MRDWEEAHCFCNEATCEQWNEDEPRLISMYMYSNSAITETEHGRLLEWDCLLELGCFLRKKNQIRGGCLIKRGRLLSTALNIILFNRVSSRFVRSHLALKFSPFLHIMIWFLLEILHALVREHISVVANDK